MIDQTNGQADMASIEARASAIFGDAPKAPKNPVEPQAKPEEQPQETGEAPDPETVETQQEGDAPATEETFDFEADGVTYAIPKALQKAFQQQKDYTQKTMEIAEQRKAFELLHEQARIANFRQAFEAEAATELQQLQAYDAVLKQPVDWASMSTDEAFRAKIQRDQWKDERDAIAKTLQGKYQQHEKNIQDAMREFKAKALDTVSKKIPNWGEATQKAIREHAIAEGYTAAELDSIVDPRHTLTLWKAQQFDQLKAKATKAVADVKTVKTTPSNPMPQHVKDKLNFRKALSKAQPGEKRKLVEARAAQIFSR
jgi:hypothetical protein